MLVCQAPGCDTTAGCQCHKRASNEMLRAITSFSMAEMRNRGLEEAAQIADYYERRGLGPSEIASRIRKLKTTPESRLAEAKVACGTIFALLPDQTGGNWNRNKRTARRT